MGTTTQDEPFHCSANAPSPALLSCWPTATQKVDDVQETAVNRFDPDTDGTFALVQDVAPMVGGLVTPPARAEDPMTPTVSATRTQAAAIINVPKRRTAPSNSLG